MGSDDLHHKKKKRSLASLKRQAGNRKQSDVVLIVCEGSETEPNYFKALRSHLRLHPANIHITHCPDGTDPLSVVGYAEKIFAKEKDYDRVFCVFDKEHSNYQAALKKINELSSGGMPIEAITTVPCFEYWFLLHFEDTTRPYVGAGKKTAGDQLKSELRKHIKDYHESDKSIFDKTKANLGIAMSRAKKIHKMQRESRTDNPSTRVYELVEYLMTVKEVAI